MRRTALAWALLVAVFAAEAQSAPPDAAGHPLVSSDVLRDRFPTASIDSVERADAALAATAGAKSRIEQEYKTTAKDCTAKMLVNACVDAAREQRRKRTAEVDAVELEANRFKRQDRAARTDADRARREAERATGAGDDARTRERNRRAFEDRQANAARSVADRARSDAVRTVDARTHKPATRRPPPPPAGHDDATRQKNVAEHAQKIAEATAHRAEIERRVAMKTADRKRRADEKAAKDARTAAAAAAKTPN